MLLSVMIGDPVSIPMHSLEGAWSRLNLFSMTTNGAVLSFHQVGGFLKLVANICVSLWLSKTSIPRLLERRCRIVLGFEHHRLLFGLINGGISLKPSRIWLCAEGFWIGTLRVSSIYP